MTETQQGRLRRQRSPGDWRFRVAHLSLGSKWCRENHGNPSEKWRFLAGKIIALGDFPAMLTPVDLGVASFWISTFYIFW